MGDRRCCCLGCWDFSDPFNYGDSTDIRPNWWEITGDWWFDDNRLTELGTTGYILGMGRVPARSAGEMHVSVKLVNASEGDRFELYAAVICNETTGALEHYLKVLFTKGAGNWWNSALYADGILVDDVDQQASPFTSGMLNAAVGEICVDHDGAVKWGVVSSSEAEGWVIGATGGGGRRYGLGNPDAEARLFDDFYVTEMRAGTTLCDDCWCACCTHLVQKTVTLTFSVPDPLDRAGCLNGLSVDLVWDWHSGTPSWDGSIQPDGHDWWIFNLTCDATSDPGCTGQNWKLSMTTGCPSSYTGLTPDTQLSTCEPSFRLVYGPFSWGDSNLVCHTCYDPLTGPASGTYYVEITD